MATATRLFRLPMPEAIRLSRPSRMSLAPEELLAVLQVARECRIRDWCMILMAYRHGLRSAEVCGLKLEEIKFGSLSIQRLQGSLKTTQKLQRHYGEPLLDEVLALQEWLRARPVDPSNALFTSRKGGPLHPTQFFRIVQATAKAAGLAANKRHPRVLRHSLAFHLLSDKVDVSLVSRALGHRSINSTLLYVRSRRASDQRTSVAVQGVLLRLFGHGSQQNAAIQ